MTVQDSATVPIRDDADRSAGNAGGGLEGAGISGTTEARLLSAVVGTVFDGKYVTATLKTAVNGEQSITYHCHAYGVDVRAGDFVWAPKALHFKEDCRL